MSRQLHVLAGQVARRAWKKLDRLGKLAKSDTTGLLAELKDTYHLNVQDETDGTLDLRDVLQEFYDTLGIIAQHGKLVNDALKGYSLNTVVLYPGDTIKEGCYEGGMADYEIDEATLYLAAARAVDKKDATRPLTVGVGEHNVCMDFRSVLAHEMGHLMMPFVEVAMNQKFRITYDNHPKEYWEKCVSTYAGTDDHELFGECFAAWTHPQYAGQLPNEIETIFESVGVLSGAELGKLAKAKQSKSVTTSEGVVIAASKIDDILDVVDDVDWFIVEGPLSEAMLSAFEDAGYTELNVAGVAATDSEMFDTISEAAKAYAKDHAAELVSGLQDTTQDQLRGIIEDAVSEGWGKGELAEEIENSFAFGEVRAKLIADNELALAYSKGRETAARDAGATGKQWLLSADHDEDEDCDCTEAAEAGVVPFDEDFTDDPDYDFPPSHVNCKCDWVGIYPEDDEESDTSDDGSDDSTDDEESDDEEHGTAKFVKAVDIEYGAGHADSEMLTYVDITKGGPGSGPHPGMGPKPTEAKGASLKEKVHSLISSGHPFTSAELQHLTGETHAKVVGVMHYMTSDKAISDKYGVKITKNGQNYQVVVGEKPSGTGAFGPGKQPGIGKPEATSLKPDAAPKETAGPKVLMSTTEADAAYAAHLDNALNTLKNSPGQIKDIQAFKDAKAQGMSDWKANTTGVVEAPSKQEIFNEDKALVGNLKSGMGMKEAYAQWKQDTINAKLASPKPVSEPKVISAVPTLDAGQYNIVPSDFKHLTVADLKPDGNGNSKFSKEMSKFNDTLDKDSIGASTNKMNVQARLANELKDSPNFQALKVASGDKPVTPQNQTLESRLVGNWASSSGDGDHVAVAMQVAAKDAFAMDDKHVATTALSALKSHGESGVYEQAAKQLTGSEGNAGLVRAGMQEYIHGMYRTTQDYLAEKGITDVYVARGMKHMSDAVPKLGGVKLQPISSFSTSYSTASSPVFKGSGNVYLAKVPASQVLSTYLTGFGCTSEYEVTVLSHSSMIAARGTFPGAHSVKDASRQAYTALSGKVT